MKQVIVTTSWDDGHILDLKVADMLKKYELKGTFYISPNNRQFSKDINSNSSYDLTKIRLLSKYLNILKFYFASKKRRFPENSLLTDFQIKTLSSSFEIGAHTMTHPFDLKKLKKKEVISEIEESKKYIEKIIGKEVHSFCYPRGVQGKREEKVVKDAGFKYGRTVERFQFSLTEHILTSGTSIHAMNQYKDLVEIAKFSGWNLYESFKNINWENLAKRMFDQICENGGIYHLFGHSWIIDIFDDWDKLDRVFAYISSKPNVTYVENRQLAELQN